MKAGFVVIGNCLYGYLLYIPVRFLCFYAKYS